MKSTDIEQSEELKACCEASKRLVRYWKEDRKNLDDYIIQCYIKILGTKKNQKLSYDDMKKIAFNELIRLHRAYIKRYKMCELPDTEYNEEDEEHNTAILSTNNLDDTLNFNALKKCFNDFFKNSSYNKQFIIDKLFKKGNAGIIAKKYKIGCQYHSEIIYKFRQDFLNYLVKVGYFDSSNNFKIDKFLNRNKIYLIKKEQGNSFDYGQCSNDLKIYKLLRNNIENINEYAKDIYLSAELLKNIVLHVVGGKCKLKLYQINILRKKYFNDYTLEELAK